MISGWALPQAAAVAWLVKKFMYPQQTATEGPAHMMAVCPAKTTAVSGSHIAPLASTAMQIGSPFTGSADLTSTFAPVMAAMPSASIAHIAYVVAPPEICAVCGVRVAENG